MVTSLHFEYSYPQKWCQKWPRNEYMNQEEELDRLKSWTCAEVCHYLATKVRVHRREAGVSQAEFANQAGIPLRTYKRFESHGKANLETFIMVLRAMERTHYLFMLFPVPVRPSATPSLDDRLRAARQRAHIAMAPTHDDSERESSEKD